MIKHSIKAGIKVNLHFKEKQYSWGDTFYILDDNDQRKYWVKSSVVLWNEKWEMANRRIIFD